jgi:hypothetical protein
LTKTKNEELAVIFISSPSNYEVKEGVSGFGKNAAARVISWKSYRTMMFSVSKSV